MEFDPEFSLLNVNDLMEELSVVKANVNEKVKQFVKKFNLESSSLGLSQSYPPSIFRE